MQPTPETQTETPSPLVALAKAIENAPGAILGLVISLIISILSDPLVTSLTFGSVSAGFYTHSVFFGVAIFCVVYVIVRMIGSHANAIVASSQNVAQSVAYHAQITSHFDSPNETPDTQSVPLHN
jgi:predicted PurR-regulated permease PerM